MTTLYDPLSPSYLDPVAARADRDLTFQHCSDCRLCVKYCFSFKSLFNLIDEVHHDDSSALTGAEHDRIVDECFQCKLCYVNCPYTPDKDQEWKIDFPALMMRSLAIQHEEGKVSRSAKLLARTDLQGKVATTFAPVVNKSNRVRFVRTVIEKTTGISRDRMLPTFAKVRFTKWFRTRQRSEKATSSQRRLGSRVALFPSCIVEYQDPAIGQAAVRVYEHNGIACDVPEGQVCCGMPWLDAGDIEKFRKHAAKNVAVLTPMVEAGHKVVVPQPTCAYVLKKEYPDHLGTEEARLVAAATRDTSEYLMELHADGKLSTEFPGETRENITWQAACHYRAQPMGPKSRDLMALTGARVQMIERCSAIDGTWGLRAENIEMAHKIAKPLMEAVKASEAEVITGDCHLANTAIEEGSERQVIHPMQVMEQAYGLKED